jgi:hypothetical protein
MLNHVAHHYHIVRLLWKDLVIEIADAYLETGTGRSCVGDALLELNAFE